MAAPSSRARPRWLRHPLARFFASVKLAVILLLVLIIAAIAGTIYESSFDAKVARAYVYGAPWFNLWLVLLGANLAVSALSRWPWRKHHTAFLVTHLGIITLLVGSLIGRIWGIEGTITLFKGDPPTNHLLVDEHQLRVHDTDGVIKGFPAEFLHHPPTPEHPRDFGRLASGAHLSVIDYAPAIEGKLNPRPLPNGGAPALHFKISTAMMGQHLESWLLADDPQNASFSMGLATIELKRGTVASPPSPSAGPLPNKEAVDMEESIFAFSKAPEEQIGHVAKGGSTGAKVRLQSPENGNKGRIAVSLGRKEMEYDVAENVGRDLPLADSGLIMRIEKYWADFRLQEGNPTSISDQPNNPAVLVRINGRGHPVAAPTADSAHGARPAAAADKSSTGGPPTVPAPGEEAPNRLTIFLADDGAMTYELKSRKTGESSGKLVLNQPLNTGWADWQLAVDETLSHAETWMDFSPGKGDTAGPMAIKDLPDGVRVRLEQDGRKFDQWLPSGWQIAVPTLPRETQLAYGFKTIPLPIGLELLDFEVRRNEGSDSPAGFKSTVRVSTAEGETATGQCWMNNPFSFPGSPLHTWSGQTFKISQASWNPENLNQSTVQILRDPGWVLKWIGSLLIVSGVFMMFYLRPYRKQTVGEPITPELPNPGQAKKQRRMAETLGGTR